MMSVVSTLRTPIILLKMSLLYYLLKKQKQKVTCSLLMALYCLIILLQTLQRKKKNIILLNKIIHISLTKINEDKKEVVKVEVGDQIKIRIREINHNVIYTLKLGTLPQSFIFVMYLCAIINDVCHIFLLQNSLISLTNMVFHRWLLWWLPLF